MAKLTDSQLMILDNLLYLREIASSNTERDFTYVEDFITYITDEEGNIDEYKIRKAEKEAKILSLEAAGKFSEAKEISQIPIEEYSVEAINNGSFQKAVDLVKSQDALMKLEIAYTSGDYKDALMAEGADKYCVDGLTAVCFKDEDGNATVIYRGTDGYTAWSENAQAACMVDTPYQQKALNFFENIPGLTEFNDVQLSGHSKGGNMVQYVTIVSAYSYMISHALTYDGQGFSDYFMETYRTLIAQNKDKIVSYSAEYDVVNALLYQLDIPRYYLESSIVSFIPFDHHYPEVIFNENNTLNDYASESEYRKQVNALIQWTIEYLRIEYDDETVVQDVYNVGEVLAGCMTGNKDFSLLLDNGTLYHLCDVGVIEIVASGFDEVLVDWAIGSGYDILEEVAEDILSKYIGDSAGSFIAEHGSELMESLVRFSLWNYFASNIDAEIFADIYHMFYEKASNLKKEVYEIIESLLNPVDELHDYITSELQDFVYEWMFVREIKGTNEDDTLIGSDARELIYGLSGEDHIEGNGGDDIIRGGKNNDEIDGGSGKDKIYGDSGSDTLDGGDGVDKIYGGEDHDAINGGEAGDYLYGEEGADTIHGNEGDDKIYGGEGTDILNGDDGEDKIYGGEGEDIISGGEDDDYLYGEEGTDTIHGDDGDDHIYGDIVGPEGTQGNDRLYGDAGSDTIEGGAGNDEIEGGQGYDYIYGGSDDDTIYGDDKDDIVNGSRDEIFGEDGNDTIYGQAGDDHIEGGNGINHMYGGDGGDTIIGGEDEDYIFGAAGQDELYGGNGINHIYGQDDNDVIHGGDDRDIIFGGYGDDEIYGANGENLIYGGFGADTIHDGDDGGEIYGGQNDDKIYAAGGNDTIDGGEGNDTMRGDHGDDTYIFKAGYGIDTIYDAAGSNTINLSGLSLSDVKAYRADGNGLMLSWGADSIILAQFFDGAAFQNYLINSDGGTMQLNSINELYGTDGDDWMALNNNGVILHGGKGGDNIQGGSGNDTLYGDEHNDTLNGDIGDDLIDGGTGDDRLYGGTGSDTYIFGKGYGIDTIEDWGGHSVIKLGDITSNEISISNDYDQILVISVANRDDKLYINNYRWNQDGFTFEFADGITGTVNRETWKLELASGSSSGSTSGENDSDNTGDSETGGSTTDNPNTGGSSTGDSTGEGGTTQPDVEITDDYVLNGSANSEWLSAPNNNDGVIDAGDGDDGLNGGSSSDKLYGGAGTDNLYGNDGDDILDGGTGTDGLNGGNGTDTYIFAKGYGNDTVNEWGSDVSIIKLTDINSDEVTLNSQSENNLVISVNGTSDTLTISNYRWSQGSFTLEFADGAIATVNKETWEMEYSQYPTVATEETAAEVSEDEMTQTNAEFLTALYAEDAPLAELISETDNTMISEVTDSTTVADETDEVADQTDLQVMILTENMSAFAGEDTVFDGINVADTSADVTLMSQLLVNSAV